MAEDTKAKANTSEVDGKNTEGEGSGAGTQTGTEANAHPKFTQADQDALAAKVRAEEKVKYEKQQTEAKRLADEAKAKEQGEFQKLADQYKGELDEAKPKLEQLDRYIDAVKILAETELKALPDEVRDMAPALDDPLDVLTWLPKGKKLAEKLAGESRPGNPRSPKPSSPTPEQAVQQNKQALRGRYAF